MVSVIIPVYNVEKYLKRCLDSVLGQTLADLEIICIDDGSTDGSGRILDDYQALDSRIQVFHKENEGYGKTMNLGLDMASGEYIGIVESDDFILPEMYQTLYDEAVSNGKPDMVKSSYINAWVEADYYEEQVLPDEMGYCNRLLKAGEKDALFSYPMLTCGAIYKRAFIEKEKIRYRDAKGASYQDTGFWFLTLAMCESVIYLSKAFYMYRRDNPNSSINSKGKMMALNEEYDYIEKQIRERKLYALVGTYRKLRLESYIYTFFRLSNELRYEFADIMCRDYEALNGRDIALDDGNRCVFDELGRDKEGYLNEMAETSDGIKRRLREARRILVYGAGTYARRTLLKLSTEDYGDKIDCCVVSDGNNSAKEIGGYRVEVFDERYRDYDGIVIISVKKQSKAFMEIESAVRDMGITYVDSDALMRYC